MNNDEHSLVLSAGSDGTVRGGYTSLMTSSKAGNTSTLEFCKVHSVTNASGGLSASSGSSTRSIANEGISASASTNVSTARVRIGVGLSFSSSDNSSSNRLSNNGGYEGRDGCLRIALKSTGTLLLASTNTVDEMPEDRAVAWQALDCVPIHTHTPISCTEATVQEKCDDVMIMTDTSYSAIKRKLNSSNVSIPVQPAPIALVAYGGATGLVRVHLLDPLSVLYSANPSPSIDPASITDV